MKKKIFSILTVSLLAIVSFGTTFEFGGGMENEENHFFMAGSAGVAFPLNDSFAMTAQSNDFIGTSLVMAVIGARFSFGDGKNTLRPFVGADGGFLSSSSNDLLPVFGLNGGVNLKINMFGFYLKAAYRLIFSYYTAQLTELVGGITLNF